MAISNFLSEVLNLILKKKKKKNQSLVVAEWTQKLTLHRMKYGMKLMNE